MAESTDGEIYKVTGPVVVATGMDPQMNDVVRVGEEGLMGEIIQIEDDKSYIQVYEDTTGVKPGEPVENTEQPLSVELGPGLLGSIYDGLQRPLEILQEKTGDFIARGEDAPGINPDEEYEFSPVVEEGEEVRPGDILGEVDVSYGVHSVMLPPHYEGGEVEEVVETGDYSVEETIAKVAGQEVSMRQEWPIRQERPVEDDLKPEIPLITGQRVLDGLFPIAKGGTAAVPGGFGTGKCVTGDTPVVLADGTKKPIKELYEQYRDRGRREINEDEEWTKLDEGPEVLSRREGKLVQKEASVVYKGMTDSTVEVETGSGREVELTPVHKLFVLTPEMEIVEKQAQDIEEDDTLLVPRNLPVESSGNTGICVSELLPEKRVAGKDFERVQEAISELEELFETRKAAAEELGIEGYSMNAYARGENRPRVRDAVEILREADMETSISRVKAERQSKPVRIPKEMDEEFGELLGFLLGDGSLKPRSLHFYNNDEKLLERVEQLMSDLFDVETERETANTVKSVKANSKVLRDLLIELGFPEEDKSCTCSIPEKVMKSTDEAVKAFLRAYFLADGGFNRYEAEITTSSKEMQQDLSYAMTRIGVTPRLSEKEMEANKHYRVRISGEEVKRFYEEVATDHRKFEEIRRYLEDVEYHFKGSDSVEISPETARRAFDSSDATRADLKKQGVKLSNYETQEENISVSSLKTLADITGDEHLAEVAGNHLEHFHPDQVVSKNVNEEPKQVYDITVPETHNFVGGNAPMLLHNTVTQQSLAKFSDADIIVYIGCGERGNEMTEVLEEFPELEDPQTGDKIINRTVLIANTSNMPVAAREASIYTGITIAEYFRDMGLDVALMADSTSRWAEAMREISARLEEMPGERGYPAYLASKLAEFYERAGRAEPLGVEDPGSVSIIGAVSPPGGDFSEPVTQNTLRVVKNFWALDSGLAEKRHFPAINWDDSYSGYEDLLHDYFAEEVDEHWSDRIQQMKDLLQKDSDLQETVQLVGKDALPDRERLTLEIATMIKQFFLQQNAFHSVDQYCPPEKTFEILDLILDWGDLAYDTLESGALVSDIISVDSRNEIAEVARTEEYGDKVEEIREQMNDEFAELEEG